MNQRKIQHLHLPLIKKQIVVPAPVRFKVISQSAPKPQLKIHQPPNLQRQPNARQTAINYSKPKQLTEEALAKIRSINGIGRGKILIILGNGPSLAEIDTSRLKNINRIHTMSVNHPDPRVWPTTYWVFCDISQYNRHQEYWNNYTGTIITGSFLKYDRQSLIKIRSLSGPGFNLNLLEGFYIGRSTVYASMQTAVWADYDRIYILGCDMCASPDGRMWYYGINSDVKPEHRATRFDKEATFYEHAAQILPQYIRDKFYFCSSYNQWEFINSFHHMKHEDAIDAILSAL